MLESERDASGSVFSSVRAESAERMLQTLGSMKGAAMKAGQMLSYIDVALPEVARGSLSALQTHSRPLPFDEVRQIVRRDLGTVGAPLVERLEALWGGA